MHFHFCPLDKQCREVRAPWRLHLFTKKYSYTLAIRPSAKMLKPNTRWQDRKTVWFTRDKKRR